MSIASLNQETDQLRGKSGGWPSVLTYLATEYADIVEITVTCLDTAKNGVWKKIDPWGIAFLDQVKQVTSKPLRLKIALQQPSSRYAIHQYEALKRRLSYLAIANNLEITLQKDNSVDTLYSFKELTNRPNCEKIRRDINDRGDNDTAGRLEKDFQAYLFGKGLYDSSVSDIRRTNERLALFGDDFVRIGKVKSGENGKGYKVEREFPTGAFCDEIKEENRILATEYVDLVTLNRNGEIAIIELKFDDPKLEVISQALNYALFFHSYRSQLTELLDKQLECNSTDVKLVTYLVSNTFHNRFRSVWRYYNKGPLTFKQVVMGYYMPNDDL